MQRKANVGTRHWTGPEWFHIDIDPAPLFCDKDGSFHPVDLVCDAAKIPLPDGSFDHIFTSEAIEHFSWHKTGAVIKEWARLLAPGGTIRIEAPDFLAACKQVLDTDTLEMDLAIQQIIFAEQLNSNDIHLAGLTHRTLPHYVTQAGLTVTNLQRGFDCGWLRVDATKGPPAPVEAPPEPIYGKTYWDSMDNGMGVQDSVMWQDIAHMVHELIGVDRRNGADRALDLRVLDVGCGYGFFLRNLRRRGYDVRGVDFSQYALDHAPEDIKPYLTWFDLTGDERLSDWYKPFHAVTTFETLEHIPADQVLKAIGHIRDALAPGGLLIAAICVAGHPDPFSDPTHQTIVPREWWDRQFLAAGFRPEPTLCRQLRWFWLFSQHLGVFVFRKNDCFT